MAIVSGYSWEIIDLTTLVLAPGTANPLSRWEPKSNYLTYFI